MECSSGPLYYVQVEGDVHRVTLDQLDDAFQAGRIDASTRVLVDGGDRWTTLGLLAGIDDPAPPSPLPASRRPVPAGRAAVSPPIRAADPARLPPGAKVAPFVSARPPPYVPALYSHRPVSIDLSELNSEVARHPRSGKRWFAAVVGLAVVSSLGAVALKRPTWAQRYFDRVGLHAAPASAPAAVPPTLPPPPAPADALAATPGPTAPAVALAAHEPDTATAKPTNSPNSSRGQGGARPKAHRAHALPTRSHAPSPSKSRPAPFSTGGNKFDPLNSSI